MSELLSTTYLTVEVPVLSDSAHVPADLKRLVTGDTNSGKGYGIQNAFAKANEWRTYLTPSGTSTTLKVTGATVSGTLTAGSVKAGSVSASQVDVTGDVNALNFRVSDSGVGPTSNDGGIFGSRNSAGVSEIILRSYNSSTVSPSPGSSAAWVATGMDVRTTSGTTLARLYLARDAVGWGVYSATMYNRQLASSAGNNLQVSANGLVTRVPNTRAATMGDPAPLDVSDNAVLALRPVTYLEQAEDGSPLAGLLPEGGAVPRAVGLVAEEVVSIDGARAVVAWEPAGWETLEDGSMRALGGAQDMRPSTVNYERVALTLIPAIQRLIRDRDALLGRVAALESALGVG